MKTLHFIIILIISVLVLACNTEKQDIPAIIFDTDFGGDADDLGAIAMLHNFHNKGECELLAIMLWNTEQYTVPAADGINRYYGNPEIPIGVRSHETFTLDWQHARPIAEAFQHELTNKDVPLAVDLYRKILAEQPDHSVVIVITGPMANIRDLILSQPDEYSSLTGKELIEQKVKEFSIMGGKFPSGDNEWNFNGNMPGVTKFVLENLTVPIVFSGYEIGVKIQTGPRLVEAGKDSPLYVGYKYFSRHAPWMNQFYQEGKITPNATYDQTSVLYTVLGGVGEYWDLVENGICVADSTGGNFWKEINNQPTNHAYLVLRKKPEEMADIIYSFMLDDF